MRHSGTWQSVWDDRILEYINEKDTQSASVGELTDSNAIHVSNAQVSRRCKKLAENGLLVDLGNGVYAITDEGKAYLREEYDAENGAYITDTGGPTAREFGESVGN
jgi:Mn-dependent DtxR family transcriptional regulator